MGSMNPARRLILTFVIAGVGALSLVASVSAQGLKIGVFDKQRIVDESRLGVTAKGAFERTAADREQEVATKQKAFETMQQAYEQQASVLSMDKKMEMQRNLARARDEWQSAAQNADRDLQRAYQSALVDIVNKIEPVVNEFGKQQGYDFLFDLNQVQFAADKHDVTRQLIQKLDAMHPSN